MIEPLILPKTIQEQEETPQRSRFTIQPLYPGYGTTLGNALRRILLSSLPGCAVSAFSIEGVQHEFSSLKDVKEDVVDIMLNIKQVRFRMTGEHEEPVEVSLEATGKGAVKAKAFKTPTGIECVTPDMQIATVTADKGAFNLKVFLTRGRGFLAVEAREKERLEIGTIAVDAIYSPVRHVAFTLEHVRVGQMTNYDKAVLVVETDGSVTPLEAIQEALSIFGAQVAGLTLDGGSESQEDKSEEAEKGEAETGENSDEEAGGDEKEKTESEESEERGEGDAAPKKKGRKKKPV